MFAPTGGFGLVAMNPHVDPDVLMVARAGFDQVVQLYAARRPLGECRRDTYCNKRDHRDNG